MTTLNSAETRLAQAVAAHQAGRLNEAERGYQAVLAEEPNQIDALHLWGVLATQTQRTSQAITSIARALSLQGPDAVMLYHLGRAHEQQGALAEAQQAYERALAIDPQFAAAALGRANALLQRGQAQQAAEQFEDVLARHPQQLEAQLGRGLAIAALGRAAEALSELTSITDALPLSPLAWAALAQAAERAEEWRLATEAYRRAVSLDPHQATYWFNLGNTLRMRDRGEEAVTCYQQAVDCRPDFEQAQRNLAAVLCQLDRDAEALPLVQSLVARRSKHADYHVSLGQILIQLGKIAEARIAFDVAARLSPDSAVAHLGRAHCWLIEQEFSAGWEEYTWRHGDPAAKEAAAAEAGLPLWRGGPLSRRTILVRGEQGIGDEILFASCLPDLLARAGQVVLTCEHRLRSLFARSFPEAIVIERAEDRPVPSIAAGTQPDVLLPAGDLPRFFRRNPGSFPTRRRFLFPEPRALHSWRERLHALGPGLKVGICWRAGRENREGRRRSIPLQAWTPILKIPGIHWAHLQTQADPTELERAEGESGAVLHRWAAPLPGESWDELAACVGALDLVITVANATAHLVGGLGVPGWVLLPFAADWRWFHDRADSPWYPSLRLFRQDRLGAWDTPLAAIEKQLRLRSAASAVPNQDARDEPHPYMIDES